MSFISEIGSSPLNGKVLGGTETHASHSAAQSAGGQDQSGSFSQIFAAALQRSTQSDLSSAYASFGYQSAGRMTDPAATMEGLLQSAMGSGEISEIETALFMLCSLMQSGGDNGFNPVLDILATLLSGLKTGKDELKKSVLGSEFSPYVLSVIDTGVFKSPIPPVLSETGAAIVPEEAWKPVSPAFVSNETDRSPERLRQVIDQFGVETSIRYQPYKRGGDTYCNIFLWDVTSALGCEIPHFVDPDTGLPRRYPDIKGAVELNAVATEDWLVRYGPKFGWREVNALTAQNYANQGKPAVTTAGDIGHVQVVCPSGDYNYDPVRGVTVAQSGARNTGYAYLSGVYSGSVMNKVRYFVHE
ncbi:MAG: hypothetical protein GX111_06220 [Clostridiales bacterium]|nr:hypothetical protein [Clostridiales bacterium]